MSISFRLGAAAILASALSACASALPNGAAPVSSLYSFNDTARFMLGDVCLPSVVEGTPVAVRADVPAVYPVEGEPNTWRAGPGGSIRIKQTGPRSCEVTASRGIAMDLRGALIREVEQSPAEFRLVDSDTIPGLITDTFCAPFPSGLSVLMQTHTQAPTATTIIVSAEAAIRRDLCI